MGLTVSDAFRIMLTRIAREDTVQDLMADLNADD